MSSENDAAQTSVSAPATHEAVPAELAGHGLLTNEVRGEAPTEQARAPHAAPPSGAGEAEQVAMFAGHVHTYVKDHIALADQKAAFLFATVAAVLAFLHANDAARRWLKSPLQWEGLDALMCAAVLGLVVGGFASLLTIAPRLGGAAPGLVFWKAIGEEVSPQEYVRKVVAASVGPQALSAAILEHAYELSRVCTRKYHLLAVATWASATGLACAVFYLAVAAKQP